MRLLVCGSRDFPHSHVVLRTLQRFHVMHDVTLVISGGAQGVDSFAIDFAILNEIDYRVYPAKWFSHGKSAGPRRNKWMLKDSNPDYVLAFKRKRVSTGTDHMISIAKEADIPGTAYVLSTKEVEWE